MNAKKLFTILIILMTSFYLHAITVADPKVDKVAERLSCYCGGCPRLTVTICGCPTADKIKADIKQKLDTGMTDQQIVDSYVAQYGQIALSSPPKSGFNLTAWLIPFFGFIAGGGVLFVFLKRQRNGGTREDEAQDSSEPPVDDYYAERLQKELEERR